MTPGIRFVLFQSAVLLPFIIGFLLQKRFPNPQDFTRKLLRINIIGIEPLIGFWCIWGLALSYDLIILPFAGLVLVIIGLLIGCACASWLRITGKRRHTFLISASLANHGFTMGGFLCCFFMGEQGLGLSLFLILYFIPYVYGFIFPAARAQSVTAMSPIRVLKKIFIDPQNMPLFAMMGGLFVNMGGYARPEMFFPIDVLLVISVALYYFTLGINFTNINIRGLCMEHAFLAGIKFMAVPLIMYCILQSMHIDASIKAVILLQSFMPVAIYAVVTAVLFDLDAPCASQLMVCNTLIFLIFILPVLFIFKGMLFGI